MENTQENNSHLKTGERWEKKMNTDFYNYTSRPIDLLIVGACICTVCTLSLSQFGAHHHHHRTTLSKGNVDIHSIKILSDNDYLEHRNEHHKNTITMRSWILIMLIAFIAYLFFVKLNKWKPGTGIKFRKNTQTLQ
ncbi:hypothetical protein BLOT_001639 [Blomia tropicalis]|nr:hypothetical protein BLOT_001639 [Blomia tropicalis]